MNSIYTPTYIPREKCLKSGLQNNAKYFRNTFYYIFETDCICTDLVLMGHTIFSITLGSYEDFNVPASWRKIPTAQCFSIPHDSFNLHGAAWVENTRVARP